MKRYAWIVLLSSACIMPLGLAAGPFGVFGPKRTITLNVEKNCADGKCGSSVVSGPSSVATDHGQLTTDKSETNLLGRFKMYAPAAKHWVHFTHRELMKKGHPAKKAKLAKVPVTALPVDASASRTVVCPMYANDQYGDCGEAMAAHTIGILSFAQGKRPEVLYSDQVLISQYLKVSGGDNGMDEDMEVGPSGIFTVGIGGNPKAIAVSSVDVDPKDVALVRIKQLLKRG